MKINVGIEFSRHPYGRHLTDSKFCGAAFRDDFLIPSIHLNRDIVLILDFKKVTVLPGASWIHEVFHNLGSAQKIYLRQHLLIDTEYSFIINTVEKFLGLKLKKNEEYNLYKEKMENKSWLDKLLT